MKIIHSIAILVMISLLSFRSGKACNKKPPSNPSVITVKVRGTLTQTSTFCGGMMPPQEMLDELARPKPFPHKKVFVAIVKKDGERSIPIDSAISDENGNFSFSLKPGIVYAVIQEYKARPFIPMKSDMYTTWDSACLHSKWKSPDATLVIKQNEEPQVKINVHSDCFYKPECGSYHGPTPP